MITIPGRIPITIHPFFWLLCFGLGFLNTMTVSGTMVWAVVIFVSVLVHEYGHALTALSFGQNAKIDLVALGGLTTRSGKKLRLWQEFIIVMNGPLAGITLFALSFVLLSYFHGSKHEVLLYGLKVATFVNLFWTLVNLLPVHPLDGGRLLSIIMEGAFGLRGIKIALFISLVFSALLTIAAFWLNQVLMGAIFFLLAVESYRTWSNSMSLTYDDQDEELQGLFEDGERELNSGHLEEAKEKFQTVLKRTKQGVLYNAASIYLAQILTRQEKYKEAYNLMLPIRDTLDEESIPLMLQLAWKTGDLHTAAAFGDEAYQLSPNYNTALINAFTHAQLGEVQATIGWIRRAVSDGLPNLKQILQRPEFDRVRDATEFKSLA